MTWLSGRALVTGIVAGVIGLIVILILGALAPTQGFDWALGVGTITAFFAGYFGHIAGARQGH